MAEIKDPENTVILETTKGKVVISLFLIWPPAMSHASRNWPAKAPMMAWFSTASFPISWPRLAT